MNIFPNRKSGFSNIKKEFNKDFQDYKTYKVKKNTVVDFPSPDAYYKLNEQLLKIYLKINKKQVIEKKIEETIDNTNIENKNITIKSSKNCLLEVFKDIYKLDLSIKIDSKEKNLHVLQIKKEDEIKDMFSYIQNANFRLIFETFNKSDIETIYGSQSLIGIELKSIIKSIFINLIKTKQIPNFCNLWIFGQENSLFIQGTYIPISEGSYSDEDYLDLMIDVVVDPCLTLSKKDIYSSIDLNKENEGLYFLLFK
jgi:hypothetical protein